MLINICNYWKKEDTEENIHFQVLLHSDSEGSFRERNKILYYTPVDGQTTNTEYVSGVQYSCESRPPLTLPGTLSCTGGTQNRKSAERTVLIANFRLFSHSFAVFSRK